MFFLFFNFRNKLKIHVDIICKKVIKFVLKVQSDSIWPSECRQSFECVCSLVCDYMLFPLMINVLISYNFRLMKTFPRGLIWPVLDFQMCQKKLGLKNLFFSRTTPEWLLLEICRHRCFS